MSAPPALFSRHADPARVFPTSPQPPSTVYVGLIYLTAHETTMDAAEADFDAKLYKASGDIIPELQVKLPLLIWHDQSRSRLRTHAVYSKCEELNNLVGYNIHLKTK